MRIKELTIKNFGKLSDFHLELGDGLQIFYGENESGKSTIHTFIRAMLFGMERGRGRASVNDTFSRYEPWENPNYYAGVLKFESGGKIFRLERHFDRYTKRSSLICENDGEELSIEHGDLEMLLDGMDQAGYENTVAVGQMKIEPNQTLASALKNYAANYYTSGNSEMDLEAAMLHLKEKRRGMDKTLRDTVQKRQEQRLKAEQEASYIWRDIHKIEEELETARKYIEEITDAIREQELAASAEAAEEAEPVKRWRVHPAGIIGMILVVIAAFILLGRPWNYLVTIVIALAEGLYVWNRMKEGKRAGAADGEIGRDAADIDSGLETEGDEEGYLYPVQTDMAGKKKQLEKLRWKCTHLEEALREKQVYYGNLQEQLEELDEVGMEYKAHDRTRLALELAERRLAELSGDIQREIGQELNAKASEVLCAITNGKYTRMSVDENLQMQLVSEGRRVGIERLSRGTAEQVYFALRMAASEVLFQEEYPVILDDTFAYYDDERLEGALRWLAEHKQQVLVFTCQKRELEIWEQMGRRME